MRASGVAATLFMLCLLCPDQSTWQGLVGTCPNQLTLLITRQLLSGSAGLPHPPVTCTGPGEVRGGGAGARRGWSLEAASWLWATCGPTGRDTCYSNQEGLPSFWLGGDACCFSGSPSTRGSTVGGSRYSRGGRRNTGSVLRP